jgi:hypothetical protein
MLRWRNPERNRFKLKRLRILVFDLKRPERRLLGTRRPFHTDYPVAEPRKSARLLRCDSDRRLGGRPDQRR